ncbi:MAG: glycosyltransferase family 2 protein [Planctomycetes bacterium]|nr:glycosyltransferase family 2 protein [Planctomycetota bacterium]
MSDRTVSIIILGCNKSYFTRRTFDGLLESTWKKVEVVFVDNGSTDDTREVLAEFTEKAVARGWRVVPILLDENVGAIDGRNRAMKKATGDYVVFMDNDIVIGVRGWLEKLTSILDADSSIGVVGPKILFAAPPHNIQCAGCLVGREGRVTFRGRGHGKDEPEYCSQSEMKTLISACWIMPRAVMEEVGELDMLFHPVQFEDIDYCYRIREKGYRVVYDPSVFVYHFENVTTDGTAGINYKYVTVKNGVKFKRKWRERIASEGGPEDAQMEWIEIPNSKLESIGELEIID